MVERNFSDSNKLSNCVQNVCKKPASLGNSRRSGYVYGVSVSETFHGECFVRKVSDLFFNG